MNHTFSKIEKEWLPVVAVWYNHPNENTVPQMSHKTKNALVNQLNK